MSLTRAARAAGGPVAKARPRPKPVKDADAGAVVTRPYIHPHPHTVRARDPKDAIRPQDPASSGRVGRGARARAAAAALDRRRLRLQSSGGGCTAGGAAAPARRRRRRSARRRRRSGRRLSFCFEILIWRSDSSTCGRSGTCSTEPQHLRALGAHAHVAARQHRRVRGSDMQITHCACSGRFAAVAPLVVVGGAAASRRCRRSPGARRRSSPPGSSASAAWRSRRRRRRGRPPWRTSSATAGGLRRRGLAAARLQADDRRCDRRRLEAQLLRGVRRRVERVRRGVRYVWLSPFSRNSVGGDASGFSGEKEAAPSPASSSAA